MLASRLAKRKMAERAARSQEPPHSPEMQPLPIGRFQPRPESPPRTTATPDALPVRRTARTAAIATTTPSQRKKVRRPGDSRTLEDAGTLQTRPYLYWLSCLRKKSKRGGSS